MSNRDQWIWMPHPAHFICAQWCRFHLATHIGDLIVSTVGEYVPDSQVRDILAQSRGIKLKGTGDNRLTDYMKKIGFEEIGAGRQYETMVFLAKPREEKNSCCPFEIESGRDLACAGYNDAGDAYRGHMEVCDLWSENKPPLKMVRAAFSGNGEAYDVFMRWKERNL